MRSRRLHLLFLICEFLLITFVYFPAQAAQNSRLALTTDITWSSKYMIGGFKVGGDQPVWQLAGKVDLYSSGFSLMYWTALQTDRTNKQFDEQDLFALYSHDFLKESRYAVNLHGFYDYWFFPNAEPIRDEFGDDITVSKKHGNKFQLGFSMPNLIPMSDASLIPTYNIYYIHYWAQDQSARYLGGAQHEFLLEYDRSIRIFVPKATYQYAGLTASTNYHNGDFGVKPRLSHSTAGVVSGVYALNSIFILGLNYQWSYEPTVNPDNEFWTTLSFVKKF